MASGATARRKLQFPKPTDADKICSDLEGLAIQLDKDAETGQGTLAERPAAKLYGRLYMVQGDGTAANNGILWWDTGSTWISTNLQTNNNKYVERKNLTKAEGEAGFEPSSSRPAIVIIELT